MLKNIQFQSLRQCIIKRANDVTKVFCFCDKQSVTFSQTLSISANKFDINCLKTGIF